eukprot:TRINITY_DN11429_c0_g1_i1.p1 TRINITY_DN11429_c0_g1~~TRINITY_DN11429_c0_g1_i1.p1  ORF type:complete len:166 (+),score=46.95 TRINITY_DN11429_c0_g1_i1:209-706(+)
MKCVRVLTKKQEITFEKEEAKKDAKFDILSVNAVQKTAKMAKEGNFRGAQANAYQWKKVLKGSDQYEDYMIKASPIYNALDKQQREDVAEKAISIPSAPAPKKKLRDMVVSETSYSHKMSRKHKQSSLSHLYSCLLYTSDAADDTPCVDLGGRRIIKKKKKRHDQ